MQKYLVLYFIAGVSAALNGYNYQHPVQQTLNTGGGGAYIHPQNHNGFQFNGFKQPYEHSTSSYGGNFGGAIIGNSGYAHHHQLHQQPIITKNFYIHSAPEEPKEEGYSEQVNRGSPRKHYRVIFIKAPSQSIRTGALSISQPQNEEKTIIYVLSKKTDIADIKAHITSDPIINNKPEVFFIKYKTPEEALYAQKQIQAQYDSLGGTSSVSDEGVASISSVVGAFGSSSSSSHDVHSSGHNSANAIGSSLVSTGPTYLPSIK